MSPQVSLARSILMVLTNFFGCNLRVAGFLTTSKETNKGFESEGVVA